MLLTDSPVHHYVEQWIDEAKAAGRNYITLADITKKMEGDPTTGRGRMPLNAGGANAVRLAFEKMGWKKGRPFIGKNRVRCWHDGQPIQESKYAHDVF